MTRTERVLKLRASGLTYDQIALAMDTTRNSVAGIIRRATKPEAIKSYNTVARWWQKRGF
jgi:transcriptional regulator